MSYEILDSWCNVADISIKILISVYTFELRTHNKEYENTVWGFLSFRFPIWDLFLKEAAKGIYNMKCIFILVSEDFICNFLLNVCHCQENYISNSCALTLVRLFLCFISSFNCGYL